MCKGGVHYCMLSGSNRQEGKAKPAQRKKKLSREQIKRAEKLKKRYGKGFDPNRVSV